MLSELQTKTSRSRAPERFLGRWGLTLLLAADLLSINLAFLIAYWLRYYGGIGGEVAEPFFVGLNAYVPILLILNIVLPLLGAASGLYRPAIRIAFFEELLRVTSTISLGFMGVTTFVFIAQQFSYSRAVLLMAWAITVGLICGVRIARRIALYWLRRRGIGVKRALVVGEAAENSLSRAVMHVVATEPGILYRLVGFVTATDNIVNGGRFRCLGTLRDLPRVLTEEQIDEVIIALPSLGREQILNIGEQCQQHGATFKIVPDLYELSLTRVDMNDLRGIPLIGLRQNTIRGLNLAMKRTLDIVIASAVIFFSRRCGSPSPSQSRSTRAGQCSSGKSD
jgi:FlaA1/EpsC-like NDP-sugar epimerase